MAENTTALVRDFLQGVAGTRPDEQTSDRDLLHRFVEHRDGGAFAVLVLRYSATVMGVALRVLNNRADAEDVSQATFLLLARKASGVAWRESVAGWLYEVAYRLALRARRAAARRAAGEGGIPAKAPPDAVAEVTLLELQQALDEELARLPEKYRTPVLLCCLEGRTRDEVAQRLGVPLSRVKSRLEEGRERLRRRLARRGVQLSVAFAGLTLSASAATAADLSAAGMPALAQAALGVAGGGSLVGVVRPEVATLFQQGVRAMFLSKLRTALAVVCAACLVAAGATGVAYSVRAEDPPPPPAKAEKPEPPKPAAPEAKLVDPKELGQFHIWRGHRISLDSKARKYPQQAMFNGRGVVVSVDNGSVRLANQYLDGGARDVLVFPETQVTIDRKPAKLADLKAGMKVGDALVVRDVKDEKFELVRIDIVREATAAFTLETVDAKAGTVTVTVLGATAPRLVLTLDPKVFVSKIDEAPFRVENLRAGMRLSLTMTDDGKTIKRIDVITEPQER
jgi:RNA polymerase sigma factor (sigma-70 family)